MRTRRKAEGKTPFKLLLFFSIIKIASESNLSERLYVLLDMMHIIRKNRATLLQGYVTFFFPSVVQRHGDCPYALDE